MTSDVLPTSQRSPSGRRGSVRTSAASTASAVYLVPLGRLLFTLIFLESVPGHFSSQTIAYAAQQGTPFASLLVPLSGILALLGGLSVLLGYHARVGAFLLALFLIPVTLVMHPFWAVPEAAAQLQRIMFMKNVSMLGATFWLMYFGSGPISIDAAQGRL